MSWSTEQVTCLRALWNEGMTASRIAAQIGATRNAVIGKVHRLGLAGRPRPVSATPRVRSSKGAAEQSGQRKMTLTHMPFVMQFDRNLALAPILETITQPRIEAVVIPISERVTIQDLGLGMCRWPLGDPLTPEFRYCGSRCDPAGPYCIGHKQMAYQA